MEFIRNLNEKKKKNLTAKTEQAEFVATAAQTNPYCMG